MKDRKGKKVSLIIFLTLIIIIIIYLLTAFTNIPGLSTLRNIWIETAMTTADHQWLATYLFPQSVIENVMNQKVEDQGEVGITELNTVEKSNLTESHGYNYHIENLESIIEDLNKIEFSDDDEFGNTVLVNDKEQGIKIVEVKTSTYTGKLVFIDDPSRVFVANTNNKGSRGELILNYLDKYDAIIGINANGFMDYEGKGLGGDIIGYSISNGEVWGKGNFNSYTTIGFDNENRLVVGKLKDYESYNLRDAAQYKPALIINGEVLMEGTAGWGMQPRTVVAQREDGVVMFLVVDGRKVGYSIGITMGEAAELLKKYGAVTAAACDGGSSSVLAYNGEIINKPSTPMVTGRYLPNAFLVKKK